MPRSTRRNEPQARAARAEVHESRFRPKWCSQSDWRRRHAKAINRSHPSALA